MTTLTLYMLAFGWHLLIANLRVSAVVPKSEVLQIILNLVQGVPYYMLIMILMFIFQKCLSLIVFLVRFGPLIWI